MNFYIGIEDLAANALIQLMQRDTKNSIDCFVTYQKIEKYGMKVVEVLKKRMKKPFLSYLESLPKKSCVIMLISLKRRLGMVPLVLRLKKEKR